MEVEQKKKRLAKTKLFESASNEKQKRIDKVIIFDDEDLIKYLIVVYSDSHFELRLLGSTDSLLEGNLLDLIDQKKHKEESSESQKIKEQVEPNNSIYSIYEGEIFSILVIDDTSVHEIDLLNNQLTRSLPLPEFASKVQKNDYEKWSLLRRTFIQSSITLIQLPNQCLAIIQDKFQSTSFSQIYIYNNLSQLILRETLSGFADYLDKGRLISLLMPPIDTIFLTHECILDEQMRLIYLPLSCVPKAPQTKSLKTQILQQKMTIKKMSNQIIAMKEINSKCIAFFMNSNHGFSNDLCNSCPSFLTFDTEVLQFNKIIPINFFSTPVIMTQVLSTSPLCCLLEFLTQNGLAIIEYSHQDNTAISLYIGKNFLKFEDKVLSSNSCTLSYIDSVPIITNLSQHHLTPSFFSLNSKRTKIFQRFPVSFAASMLFLLINQKILEKFDEIALHNIMISLGCLNKVQNENIQLNEEEDIANADENEEKGINNYSSDS